MISGRTLTIISEVLALKDPSFVWESTDDFGRRFQTASTRKRYH